MGKKQFIALADVIAYVNKNSKRQNGTYTADHFSTSQLNILADFCQSQNPAFKRDRRLSYIKGECGPNGGAR